VFSVNLCYSSYIYYRIIDRAYNVWSLRTGDDSRIREFLFACEASSYNKCERVFAPVPPVTGYFSLYGIFTAEDSQSKSQKISHEEDAGGFLESPKEQRNQYFETLTLIHRCETFCACARSCLTFLSCYGISIRSLLILLIKSQDPVRFSLLRSLHYWWPIRERLNKRSALPSLPPLPHISLCHFHSRETPYKITRERDVACRKISKLFCHNSCRLLLARSSAAYTLFSIFFPPCCLSHRERYYQSTRRIPVARVQPYLDLLSRGIPGSLSSFLPVSMVIHVGRKLGELIVMYAMKLRFSLSFFCSLFLGDS